MTYQADATRWTMCYFVHWYWHLQQQGCCGSQTGWSQKHWWTTGQIYAICLTVSASTVVDTAVHPATSSHHFPTIDIAVPSSGMTRCAGSYAALFLAEVTSGQVLRLAGSYQKNRHMWTSARLCKPPTRHLLWSPFIRLISVTSFNWHHILSKGLVASSARCSHIVPLKWHGCGEGLWSDVCLFYNNT